MPGRTCQAWFVKTIQLRRYTLVEGEYDAFLAWWKEWMPRVRRAAGFGIEFAYGLPETNEFVWAVSAEGDHAAFLAQGAEQAGFEAAYAALEEGHLIARELVAARVRAGLTQAEVANRMGTSVSFVSRLEAAAGRPSPTLGTLRKYANALGCELRISLVDCAPVDVERPAPRP
jgi:DNA-binding transcriptional regulator YiaG